MSITDELREWIDAGIPARRALAMATRIDEAHEKALKEAREGWVELPLIGGEPIRVGDTLMYVDDREFVVERIGVGFSDCIFLYDSKGNAYTPSFCNRPKQAPYDKNGEGIKVGDWIKNGEKTLKVTSIGTQQDGFCTINGTRMLQQFPIYSIRWEKGSSEYLEKVPEPDSWEKLDDDVKKDMTEYWKCGNTPCDRCPAIVNDKKPLERYGTGGCGDAKTLDVFSRAKKLSGVE